MYEVVGLAIHELKLKSKCKIQGSTALRQLSNNQSVAVKFSNEGSLKPETLISESNCNTIIINRHSNN